MNDGVLKRPLDDSGRTPMVSSRFPSTEYVVSVPKNRILKYIFLIVKHVFKYYSDLYLLNY